MPATRREPGAKQRAEAAALAAGGPLRSVWFSPGHHDLHLEFPSRLGDLLAGAVREGFFRVSPARRASSRSWGRARPRPLWSRPIARSSRDWRPDARAVLLDTRPTDSRRTRRRSPSGRRVLRSSRPAHDRGGRLSGAARRRSRSLRTPIAEAAALSRLRTAGFVFAGPGSPSYALSVWKGSPVPEALSAKLAEEAPSCSRARRP